MLLIHVNVSKLLNHPHSLDKYLFSPFLSEDPLNTSINQMSTNKPPKSSFSCYLGGGETLVALSSCRGAAWTSESCSLPVREPPQMSLFTRLCSHTLNLNTRRQYLMTTVLLSSSALWKNCTTDKSEHFTGECEYTSTGQMSEAFCRLVCNMVSLCSDR